MFPFQHCLSPYYYSFKGIHTWELPYISTVCCCLPFNRLSEPTVSQMTCIPVVAHTVICDGELQIMHSTSNSALLGLQLSITLVINLLIPQFIDL